jgi:hypothetical protein
MADRAIQFRLQSADPPPKPPAWLEAFSKWLSDVLKPVGRFFDWLASFLPDAPVARFILYALLAGMAVAFLWMLWMRLSMGQWRFRHPAEAEPADMPVEEWAPDAAPARTWLDEADALAARGHFAEAIHHLLFRSVEDIAKRRPNVVRPALTSRELASAEAIPQRARNLFADIAMRVERSFFGGQPVDQQDWSAARAAYSDFALSGSWRA